MPQVLSRLILKAFEWAEKSPEDSESMLFFLLNFIPFHRLVDNFPEFSSSESSVQKNDGQLDCT
jgi:hypothetical protein